MRIALFITCFNDTLFPDVGIATTQLLERLGHTVDFPEAQTCCGQMHYNTGYQRETIPLLRHFLEVFDSAEVIVAPSASCVGMVRDLYPRAAALSGDEAVIQARPSSASSRASTNSPSSCSSAWASPMSVPTTRTE
jgi:L-lactate dehydrogenase complex protein LldE